jgi:hypothetical protein
MAMPETAMNENHGSIFCKDYIRLSGQVFSVQSKSKAQRMKKRTDPYLRLCVGALDGCHISAALLGIVNIDHR